MTPAEVNLLAAGVIVLVGAACNGWLVCFHRRLRRRMDQDFYDRWGHWPTPGQTGPRS